MARDDVPIAVTASPTARPASISASLCAGGTVHSTS